MMDIRTLLVTTSRTLVDIATTALPPVRARGVKSRMCPPYPQRDRKKATKWGGVSESPFKKGGPVSVLGRAR